jgi:hypothetical protein
MDRIVVAILTAAANLDLHLIDPASRYTVQSVSRNLDDNKSSKKI